MNVQWSGVTGNWFTASNWVPASVPTTGDTVTIESGTAMISSSTPPKIVGQAIVLDGSAGGGPVLEAVNTVFEGTSTGTEINTTLTITGTLVQTTNARFIVSGNSSFDGQIYVEAIGGSLTIESQTAGSTPGTFRLLNTDKRAAIVVTQESFLDFEGQTFVNETLIQIEGSAQISAGVKFEGGGGVDGLFALENGGRLEVDGIVTESQHLIFVDGTGKLTIDNLAGFDGVIDYTFLPNAANQPVASSAGGQIDLTQVAAQSAQFTAVSSNLGTLTLYAGPNQTGGVVATLNMGMVGPGLTTITSTLSTADFTLTSNGNGGTVITYAPGGTNFIESSLPAPIIAQAGDIVSLTSMLKDSFGTSALPFDGVWLLPSKPFENTSTNVGYWESPNITPQWFIKGRPVTEPTFVKDISKVTLMAGNQIIGPAAFQVRLTEDKSGTGAEWITYDIWTVDPAIVQAMQTAGFLPGEAPTAATVAAAANAFAEVYGDGTIPNTNLCNSIADNVAAGAGAPMPLPNTSFDPSQNVEGGFWRIVYASDVPNPVSDWSGLVQPGDIVRMGWFHPESGRVSGHSTTVLSGLNSDGKITFYDNVDSGTIGIHDSAYWHGTDPEDITIYRIDPNQQYLILGSNLSETLFGSVYDNLIRPGGGKDIIRVRAGDNEVEGTAAQLNGIKVKGFNSGDSFHFTDLDPLDVSVKYGDGKLQVFEEGQRVAVVRIEKPDSLRFVVTSDADGGTMIEFQQKQQSGGNLPSDVSLPEFNHGDSVKNWFDSYLSDLI